MQEWVSSGDYVTNRRLFVNDPGLLNYLMKLSAVSSRDAAGTLNETFVWQALQRARDHELISIADPAFGILGTTEYDFTCQSVIDRCRYTFEVKSGKGSNPHLTKLLDRHATDYVIHLKVNIKGGQSLNGKGLTLPIWMAERIPFDFGRDEEEDVFRNAEKMIDF